MSEGKAVDNKVHVTAGPLARASRKNGSAMIHFCKAGQSFRKADLRSPRKNTRLEHIVAVASLLLFFGLFYVGPMLSAWGLYASLVLRDPIGIALTILFITDSFLPAGKYWETFSASWVFDTWRRYFNLRVVMPPAPFLDQERPHLLAQVPHACFPFGGLLTQYLAGDRGIGMPTRPVYGVIASVLLQLPLYKHFFAWLGCASAGSKTFFKLLQSHTVGCIPEGVAGIFEGATRERERIYMKSRRGFIRLAIMAGADIVPVYHLGNSQMLTYCGSEWLSRKTRMTVGMFWGWKGFPIPYQHDIITCVGLPIKVQRAENPSEEQISSIQGQLLASLEALYYQHRHLIGWEGRPLEIV